MNQEKIGKFIAQKRKLKKLTQEQLAENLVSVPMQLVNGNEDCV